MIFKINNTLEDSSISTYKILIKFILLSFALVQIVISNFNLYVIFTVFLIIFFTFLTIELFFNKKNLIFYFFPCVLLFSLNFVFLSGPLIFKTIFLQNVNDNLHTPVFTFFIASVYQLTANLSFLYYKKNKKLINFSKLIASKIFKPMRSFDETSIRYMFFIFILVTFNRYYLIFFDRGINSTTDFGDVTVKILYQLSLFYYLPLILTFKYFFLDRRLNKFIFYSIITFYIVNSFFLSLAGNARSDFYSLFIILSVLIFFYKFLLSNKFVSFSKVYILFLLIVIISSYSIVSNSILKNRSDRSVLTPKDLLFKSLDPKQLIMPSIKDYYEGMTYTENELIDRLVNIKFLDYSLKLSNNLSNKDAQQFTEIVIGKYLSIFPQNFINIFSKNFKKKDYLIATGSMLEKYNYGSYRGGKLNVGSYLAELKVMLNSYILTFMTVFVFFIFIYILIQSFQIITDNEIIFSPVIFVISPNLFFLVASDTSLDFVYILIRGAFELVILYYILSFFKKKSY